MKLVIAEKPSVALEISRCLGALERVKNNDGMACYKGNGYYISNALGHLYSIGTPLNYGYNKSWSVDELPLNISSFNIFPIISNDEQYNSILEKQRKLLSELMNMSDVDEIICATDAGREGELIFRYIYLANKCNKPVKRLWISSLTEESILKGFNELKSDNDYDNMYVAGYTRAKADWIVGMNLSRLYSCLDNCTHKVGRVKTPLLSVVVNRDLEIKSFVKQTYYKIILENGATSCEEFPTGELAQSIADKCKNSLANVTLADVVEKSENHSLLFSLTTLQQEANDLYGYTASETLKATQDLYEKKFVTYPRTDSNYISEDMRNDVSVILTALSKADVVYRTRVNSLDLQTLTVDNRVIDNAKITDHHAIIPTKQVKFPAELNQIQLNVLHLIANRFICAVEKPHKFIEAKYEFWAEDNNFELKVKKDIELGWKEYDNRWKENVNHITDEDNIPFVEYKLNDSFNTGNVVIKQFEKQPLKHYTDSTLLSVMANINNLIADETLKKCIKGKGIGTPATRATIIDELIQNKYLYRKGKQLIATDFGIEFIQSLPQSVKSLERTAEWEQILEDISIGKSEDTSLMNDISRFVNLTIQSEKSSDRKPIENTNAIEKVVLGKCPRCGKNIYEGKDNFYCESGKQCNFTIWKHPKFFTSEIKANDVIKLLNAEPITLKAKSKDGEIYQAKYIMNDTGTYINFERIKDEKVILGKCPRCGKIIYEGKSNFYCESGKQCNFTIWKSYKYPELINVSVKMVKELLSAGKTTVTTKMLNGTSVKNTYTLQDKDGKISLIKCK